MDEGQDAFLHIRYNSTMPLLLHTYFIETDNSAYISVLAYNA